jgi:hypothetical protein
LEFSSRTRARLRERLLAPSEDSGSCTHPIFDQMKPVEPAPVKKIGKFSEF